MAPPTEHPAQNSLFPAEFRRETRQRCIAARLALAPEAHAAASAAIEARLLALLSLRAVGVLGFCSPIRGEFDARPLALRLIALGWRAAMPVVMVRNAPMIWRAWSATTPMGSDDFGIAVPLAEEVAAPNLVLAPLVAFDAAGYRLGYGGGYFDRTLAATEPRPETIGVGFEVGRVDSILPEPHDIALDRIVTEAGDWIRANP